MVQRIKIAQQTPQEGLSTRGVSSPIEPRRLQLVCLSLVVMRCQPLRRALCALEKIMKKWLLVMLASFSSVVSAENESLDCKNAMNTLEINQCASMALD